MSDTGGTCGWCGKNGHRASQCPSRRGLLAVPLVALLLAGCATGKGEPVVYDTFCLTAQKRKWSVNDTAETIRDAEAWNAGVDKRCPSGKKTS